MVIIPAEEAGKEPNKIDLIGTGPFQFVEYQPDSHVKLKRFDGYVPGCPVSRRRTASAARRPLISIR